MTQENLSFGSYLRSIREKKQIEVEEIAQKTNIQASFLRDMEAENWTQLPEPVFLRGMFRNIAFVLGVDAQELIARYNVAIGDTSAMPTGQTPREVLPPLRKDKGGWSKYIMWLLALVALLLIGIYVYSLVSDTTEQDPTGVEDVVVVPEPVLSSEGEMAVDRTEPVSTEPEIPAASVDSQNDNGSVKKEISLDIQATERTWIRLQEAGVSTDYMLEPGETVHLAVSPSAKMVLGNAGGVKVTYNGNLLPSQGLSGEVKTLSFSQPSSEHP